MEKVLTVIVPSYNTRRFVEKVLSSFLSVKNLRALDALVVDDGSADDTAEIARALCEKAPDSLRVFSQQNGGHGSAINTGVALARGEFLCVVDGDDWVDAAQLDRLLDFLPKTGAQMVVNPYRRVSETTGASRLISVAPDVPLFADLPFEEVAPRFFASLHSVVWRTRLFRENALRMTEKTFYEDNEYCVFPIPCADTVAFTDCDVYRYRVDQAGQSVSFASKRKRLAEHRRIVFSLIDATLAAKAKGVGEAKLAYMERVVDRMIGSHYEIYLSFPMFSKGKMRALKEFDAAVREKYPPTGREASFVRLLRGTRFRGYEPFHAVFLGYAWLAHFPRGNG